jgi:hypothetical protein
MKVSNKPSLWDLTKPNFENKAFEGRFSACIQAISSE